MSCSVKMFASDCFICDFVQFIKTYHSQRSKYPVIKLYFICMVYMLNIMYGIIVVLTTS